MVAKWVAGSPRNGWPNHAKYASVQYTAYETFNGASHNYDGYGRNAADNNTLYLATYLMW